MDNLIDKYGNLGNRLVFVSDGAVWIKNWIEDAFPKEGSIEDYYHTCEEGVRKNIDWDKILDSLKQLSSLQIN